MVPEVRREEIRELIHEGYRVIYRQDPDRISILTIRHTRQGTPLSLMDHDRHDELQREYLRICPDEEPGGISLAGLTPEKVLRDWRGIPDGAGPLAIVESVERILRRKHGPDA